MVDLSDVAVRPLHRVWYEVHSLDERGEQFWAEVHRHELVAREAARLAVRRTCADDAEQLMRCCLERGAVQPDVDLVPHRGPTGLVPVDRLGHEALRVESQRAAATPTFAAQADATVKLYSADRLLPRRFARRALGYYPDTYIRDMEAEDAEAYCVSSAATRRPSSERSRRLPRALPTNPALSSLASRWTVWGVSVAAACRAVHRVLTGR